MSTGKTTYVPSIDGYLFTYNQENGFQKQPMSIRELAYTAPFRSKSGEIFTSGKITSIFFIDRKNGNITYSFKSNTSVPMENAEMPKTDHITMLRIDYDLYVIEQVRQLVRYSEFEIFTNQNSNTIRTNVDVQTQNNNEISVSVNETAKITLTIPGFVTGIYGSDRKFIYTIVGNESGTIADQNMMFLPDISLAVPTLPHEQENITENATNIQNETVSQSNNTNENETGSTTPHKVNKMLPNQRSDDEQPIPYTYKSILPANFISIPIILVLLYFSLRAVLFLIGRLMRVERKLDPIIIDQTDKTKGTCGGRKLTLFYRKEINIKSLNLARSVGLLDNTAKFLKDEFRDNVTIIGYQQLEPFNFEKFDAVQFLERTLVALKSIFNAGLVHGSISEDVIFSDGGKATIAGLEWSCTKTYSSEKRAKDIWDLAMVIARSYNHYNIHYDPLLLDLLSDMESSSPAERPTPDEALGHPLFWTIAERTKIYYSINDELSSTMTPANLVQKFEEHRIKVLQCTSWMKKLPKQLVNDLKSRGDYGGDSMRDLVRMIRNKCEHFSETPPKLQAILGTTPDEVFNYFDNMFPNLFLYSYYFYISYCS
ncbi:hypothetical protein TVAG_022090 [Trichomonas vaginalis G3]|uniref:KEN domain-containing protein n=1 Tax=Trichomonas vaginalis (strain ATCC PRA-98 / G3) TaxID=412133 RepID=A2FFS7_TRIV3|nr:ribonuclease protein [Trichomonas vaginalis G3]EAX96226.1 hypothetical protein TVAG_022090 [Trichomonas vaginalis G3]KAI5520984.1 ribonuclease protein [Trichomonas vaginalis G3]|eukprot:XP_001309156.1 hypothetical protein [Trichomonas vaginalis G3]